MRSFLRFLRPLAYLRRRAILGGVFGGSRAWLAWGGAAWGLHWMGRVLGVGEPRPRYIRELAPGERLVVVHEPLSPAATRKAGRKARRAQRRAGRHG